MFILFQTPNKKHVKVGGIASCVISTHDHKEFKLKKGAEASADFLIGKLFNTVELARGTLTGLAAKNSKILTEAKPQLNWDKVCAVFCK